MADEEKEGGKGKKLVLIGGLVVVIALVAALAVGATLFFLDRSDREESSVQETPETLQTAFYYSFPEAFTTPLISSDRRQRFMRISLAVKLENELDAAAVERHLPLLKNNLNMLFNRQDYQTLQTPEGKIQLQMAAEEVVQQVLERENVRIERVLITDFIMQ